MKNKEELKSCFEGDNLYLGGYVKNKIDQLEEPEVLTQELPAIPKFVAEYLDLAKSEVTLMRVLELANTRNELPKWEKEYDWISANDETFARAWLDGYTVVEEEQKYIVKLPLPGNKTNDFAVVDIYGDIWLDREWPSHYKMTEEEIKSLPKGEVYFEHFAKRVEELEE